MSIVNNRSTIIGMDGMKEFGALVKSARERMGWTQMELSARLGRPNSFLARIEGGKNSYPPDPHDFHAIARELRLNKDDMLRVLGYLDPPSGDADGVSEEDRALFEAISHYLPQLGEAQRRHVIETARMFAEAAAARQAQTPGASAPADRSATRTHLDHQTR